MSILRGRSELRVLRGGRAFGDSIAVAEIGRLPVESVEPHASLALASGATAGAFTGLLREMHQDKLREHMHAADAVVVGRVVSVEKAGTVTYSEHDPDWWRATIDVYHVERGQIKRQVRVLFANSSDVRWRHTPKPKPSQGASGFCTNAGWFAEDRSIPDPASG